MKRLIGFLLFWLGAGMLVMFCMARSLLLLGIILLLMVIGYNLFCSCK